MTEPTASVDPEVVSGLLRQAQADEVLAREVLCNRIDAVEALECLQWVEGSLEAEIDPRADPLWVEEFKSAWAVVAAEAQDAFEGLDEAGWYWQRAVKCARNVVSQAFGVQPREEHEFPDFELDTDEPGTRWVEVVSLPQWSAQHWSFDESIHDGSRMLAAVSLWMHRSDLSALEPKSQLALGVAHVGVDGSVQWVQGPQWDPPGYVWIKSVLRRGGVEWEQPQGLYVGGPPLRDLEPESEGLEL